MGITRNKLTAPFVITYENGEKFEGDLFAKQWKREHPLKLYIYSVTFSFAGFPVRLEGFEEYNLTYETISVVGKGGGISKIVLAGRHGGISTLFEYNFLTKKINEIVTPVGQEYGNLISNTWKTGIKGMKPKIYRK